MTPRRYVLSTDVPLTESMAATLREHMAEAWTKGAEPARALVLGDTGHLAVETPDGGWWRLCHDHRGPIPVESTVVVGVLPDD